MPTPNRPAETDVGAFTRHMEAQAYIGYREWPIFLALREAQLKQLLTASPQLVASLPPTTEGPPSKNAKPA